MNTIGKTIVCCLIAALAVAVGCKSIPTADELYATSKAVGVAAALVANQTKINDKSRNVIVEIINQVDAYVPTTNETVSVAWNKIAEKRVQILVDEKKIDADQTDLILSTFKVCTKSIDYLVYTRFPAVGKDIVLVESAAHGFCEGFLSYFKPVNDAVSAGYATFDKAAYDYLSAK